MAIQFEIASSHACVVRPDSLRRVWSILAALGPVTASMKCADDAKRQFDDVEKMLAFENARSKEVLVLSIAARSTDYKDRADVRFGGWSAPAEVTLDVRDETRAERLREDLRDVVEGMRAWYAPLARIDLVNVAMAIAGVASLALSLGAGESGAPRARVPFGRALIITIQLLAGIGVVILVIRAVHRAHRRYFPRVAFLIGQGADRFATDDQMRWVVIVGCAVSIVASLVVAFAQGWLFAGP